MEKQTKNKGVVRKIVDDLVESTKKQHQITKAQMELNKKSPSQAKADFKQRHKQARTTPIKKQEDQLAEIQEKINIKKQKYN